MKYFIYLATLALFLNFYSCDTMIPVKAGNITSVKPVLLVPKNDTTLYQNQKIIYFRLALDTLDQITTTYIYHADTLIDSINSFSSNSGNKFNNFVDIGFNEKKFTPGIHIFKFQFIDEYNYKSEFTILKITILPEDIPKPEVFIEINNNTFNIIFNTDPLKFSNYKKNDYPNISNNFNFNYTYVLEYNNIFDYNDIKKDTNYITSQKIENYILLEIYSEDSSSIDFKNPVTSFNKQLEDYTLGDTLKSYFSTSSGEYKDDGSYFLKLASNSGWINNYYHLRGLKK